VVMQGIGRAANTDDANKDPRMAYVPPALLSFWGGQRYAAMADNARNAARSMKAMVAELHRAGVPIMVGTDLANPYVFAGFSVHDEMVNFQDAGIPAADVLRAATVVPARFCGVADTLGTVDEGKAASLVLVRGNPLVDVRHAADIEAVFLDGRYLDRNTLDGMLEGVATANRPIVAVDEERLELPGAEVARGRYLSKFQEFDAGAKSSLSHATTRAITSRPIAGRPADRYRRSNSLTRSRRTSRSAPPPGRCSGGSPSRQPTPPPTA